MSDLQLVTWCRPPKRSKTALAAMGFMGLGLSVLCLSLVKPTAPVVVYNASASAPLGFYAVTRRAPVNRGDLVLAQTPPSVRRLAAGRSYLPADVPLIKRVAALGGDVICVRDRNVSLNHRLVARQLIADRLGRPLPLWTACRALAADEVFLLMANVPASFDGRYFGPVRRDAILGRLTALWPK